MNALQGFELHKSLTGREKPNVVVFSNLIWDLGRWLYIGGTTDPSRCSASGWCFWKSCMQQNRETRSDMNLLLQSSGVLCEYTFILWFFFRTQHQGKPMLRDQEYLPLELIEDWMQSTELQLKRIEVRTFKLLQHYTLVPAHPSCSYSEAMHHADAGG